MSGDRASLLFGDPEHSALLTQVIATVISVHALNVDVKVLLRVLS